jgi:cobalt-zinc-cadmium resistance protein CzcA
MTYNGEVDAVGGVVMMLKGANSNEVVKELKIKFQPFRNRFLMMCY